jgi:hypothetical protein
MKKSGLTILLKRVVKEKMKEVFNDNVIDSFDNAGVVVNRTELGICKNIGCHNKRRHGSAYCGMCNK